eukprot:545429-Prymnesium_polylepis.2
MSIARQLVFFDRKRATLARLASPITPPTLFIDRIDDCTSSFVRCAARSRRLVLRSSVRVCRCLCSGVERRVTVQA